MSKKESMTKIQIEEYEAAIVQLAKDVGKLKYKLDVEKSKMRDIKFEYEKLEKNYDDCVTAAKLLLKPLLEENKALYLIHENVLVREFAIDILRYDDDERF